MKQSLQDSVFAVLEWLEQAREEQRRRQVHSKRSRVHRAIGLCAGVLGVGVGIVMCVRHQLRGKP